MIESQTYQQHVRHYTATITDPENALISDHQRWYDNSIFKSITNAYNYIYHLSTTRLPQLRPLNDHPKIQSKILKSITQPIYKCDLYDLFCRRIRRHFGTTTPHQGTTVAPPRHYQGTTDTNKKMQTKATTEPHILFPLKICVVSLM